MLDYEHLINNNCVGFSLVPSVCILGHHHILPKIQLIRSSKNTINIYPLPQITPRPSTINLKMCCELNSSALSCLCFHTAVLPAAADKQRGHIVYGRSFKFGLLFLHFLWFLCGYKLQLLSRKVTEKWNEPCLLDSTPVDQRETEKVWKEITSFIVKQEGPQHTIPENLKFPTICTCQRHFLLKFLQSFLKNWELVDPAQKLKTAVLTIKCLLHNLPLFP